MMVTQKNFGPGFGKTSCDGTTHRTTGSKKNSILVLKQHKELFNDRIFLTHQI
jgi:hypothetical protein